MRLISIRKKCKKRIFIMLAIVCLGIALSAFAEIPSAASRPEGLRNDQEFRKKHQKEYVREHSDSKGKVRPEAYLEGIEHVRRMKVAPYIGARPLGDSPVTPSDTLKEGLK